VIHHFRVKTLLSLQILSQIKLIPQHKLEVVSVPKIREEAGNTDYNGRFIDRIFDIVCHLIHVSQKVGNILHPALTKSLRHC